MKAAATAYWLGLQRSNGFIEYFTSGLEGEDWMTIPQGVPNPPIWTLGHLAHSRASFLELLTGEQRYEDGWAEILALGAIPKNDPHAYPSVEECKSVLAARMEDLRDYLEDADENDLAAPPAIASDFFKTKASVLVHLTHHEAHHTGVLSLTRRLLGKEKLL